MTKTKVAPFYLGHGVHWLDVADRIRVKLCVQVLKCQHSMAACYLAEFCRSVSSIDGHRHVRSARCGQLDVPRVVDCQHSEDVCSVMLDRLLGTLFLSVSTTMHCLFRHQRKHTERVRGF